MSYIFDKYFIDSEGSYPNTFNTPANKLIISEVEKALNLEFPNDYKEFLQFTNGYTGFVGKNYVDLYQVEIVGNNEYCKNEFPWAIEIGSNGGGEMYIMYLIGSIVNYGVLPMIGDDNDLIPLGNTFEGFIKHLYFNDFWNN